MSDSYQAIYDAVRSRISGCDVGRAIESAIRNSFDISYAIPIVMQNLSIAAVRCQEEITRPSAIYRPAISIDGNQWCALYGDNLHEGVAGFGESPAKAMDDFDANWRSPHNAIPSKVDAVRVGRSTDGKAGPL